MGWGLFLPFLMGEVRDQGENKNWHWLFWGLGGAVLLAGAQAVILGNLGAELAARQQEEPQGAVPLPGGKQPLGAQPQAEGQQKQPPYYI